MERIRIGNDFVYLWSIERGGQPENLDTALEKKLLIKVFRKSKEIPFTTTGNVIRVELTPSICSIVGTYNLEFSYKLPDMSLSDDERTCTVDIDAFQIVGRTAQADEVEEITSTSDVAIGLNGKDAFEVWLEDNPGGTKEDYFIWLRKPATDIEETVGQQEALRESAESLRVEAELLRQSNTQEAISNTESATENANTAAQNADDARENIMPSVLNNEEVQADVYAQLNARITALEAILTNKIKDRIDVTKEFNVWGKTNLILYGDSANTKTPDFIGQTYIDTTNGNVYIAVGVSNAGNWKLV